MKKPDDIREYLCSPGFVIRDPRTKARVPHVAPAIRVHFSSFWARRELDGSVFTPKQVTDSAPAKRSTKATTEG